MGRYYSEAQRAEAVRVIREVGLAEASRRLGFASKATLSRWYKEDTGESYPNERLREQTAKATAMSREVRLQAAEARRAVMVEDLQEIAARGMAVQREILDVVESAQRQVNDPGVTAEEVETLRARIALIQGGVNLRDIVGMTTRAIHDFLLLTGEETERGGVTVVLSSPGPAGEPPQIIDLPAEPASRALT